jgi:hypothetical protein
MKDVDGDGRLVKGAHPVNNPAGDAPDVAGAKQPGDSIDGEFKPSRKQDAHLLMGVGMIGNERVGLKGDVRDHEPAAGAGRDLDARKDLMSRAGTGWDEEAGSRFVRFVFALTLTHWSRP